MMEEYIKEIVKHFKNESVNRREKNEKLQESQRILALRQLEFKKATDEEAVTVSVNTPGIGLFFIEMPDGQEK